MHNIVTVHCCSGQPNGICIGEHARHHTWCRNQSCCNRVTSKWGKLSSSVTDSSAVKALFSELGRSNAVTWLIKVQVLESPSFFFLFSFCFLFVFFFCFCGSLTHSFINRSTMVWLFNLWVLTVECDVCDVRVVMNSWWGKMITDFVDEICSGASNARFCRQK